MRDYKGDFEVHVTARLTSDPMLGLFRQWCQDRKFGCVWIVLGRGTHVHQPMATWRRRNTVLSAVLAEAHLLAAQLNEVGIPVARVKVEAAPENDEIPVEDVQAAAHKSRNYFEHHVKLLRAATASRDALLRTCEQYSAHLSRNAWREVAAGQEERFVTMRSYRLGRNASAKQLQELLAALTNLGEQVIEIDSEYCVYDSNLELDAGWLSSSASSSVPLP
jgi:hypothetical protein